MRRLKPAIVRGVRRCSRRLYRFWPGTVEKPVFVVGCARSGTTILGEILRQHPDLFYLNEPRYIWCSVIPELDIWGHLHPLERGRLFWDAPDFNPSQARLLHRFFALELFLSRRRRLVEKTPINVFRMRWIKEVFPDAQFIHLIRHPHDVALSLAQAWQEWGRGGGKPPYWDHHHHHLARKFPFLREKLDLLQGSLDLYSRALFSWLCAVTIGRKTGTDFGPQQYLEIQYEALVSSPIDTLEKVFPFLGEALPSPVADYAIRVLRADAMHKPNSNPERTEALTGPVLRELGYSLRP